MTFMTLTRAVVMLDQRAAANPEARAYLNYCHADAYLTATLFSKQRKPMLPNETCRWGFTAEPDFARICRELEAQGAIVGRVTVRGDQPVTLVDLNAPGLRARPCMVGHLYSYVSGTNWARLKGDRVADLLPRPKPVEVVGFKAPEPPAPKAPTVWVRSHDGRVREYPAGSLGTFRGPPSPGIAAMLDPDGKVYPLPGPGRRKIGVHVGRGAAHATPPAPNGLRWGIFVKDGHRSADYSVDFTTELAARDFLATIAPDRREVNGYFVRPV